MERLWKLCPAPSKRGGPDSHFDMLDVGTDHVPFQLEPNGGGAAETPHPFALSEVEGRS